MTVMLVSADYKLNIILVGLLFNGPSERRVQKKYRKFILLCLKKFVPICALSQSVKYYNF